MVTRIGIQQPDGQVRFIEPDRPDRRAYLAGVIRERGGDLVAVTIDDATPEYGPYEAIGGALRGHRKSKARADRQHLAELLDQRRRYQAAQTDTGVDYSAELAEVDAEITRAQDELVTTREVSR